MSADFSETTALLGKSGARGRSMNTACEMNDKSREEEDFYRRYSLWGQVTTMCHPFVWYVLACLTLTGICLPNVAIGLWALLKALTYFSIATQPAIAVIILSVVIISVTVVIVTVTFVLFIEVRFGGTSLSIRSTSAGIFIFGNTVTMVVGFLLSVLGIVTVSVIATSVPDAAFSANSSFDNYLTYQTIQETWDMAQEDLKCCGLYSFTDYENLFNNLSVPVSCCNTTHPLVNQSTCPEIVTDATLANQTRQIYTEGCVPHLESFYQYIFTVVGWYYISWGILLVIAAVLSCCVVCPISWYLQIARL